MSVSLRSIRTLLVNETGPTAVEYAVLLALIVVVCAMAIAALGGKLPGIYQNASDELMVVPGA